MRLKNPLSFVIYPHNNCYSPSVPLITIKILVPFNVSLSPCCKLNCPIVWMMVGIMTRTSSLLIYYLPQSTSLLDSLIISMEPAFIHSMPCLLSNLNIPIGTICRIVFLIIGTCLIIAILTTILSTRILHHYTTFGYSKPPFQ